MARAVTAEITGTRGGEMSTCPRAALELGHGRGHHRRVERARHGELHRPQPELLGGATASANALASPESTTCWGELSFATASPCASAISRACSAAPRPCTATIPPSPARTPDSCISRPRSATSSSPSRSSGTGGDQRRELAERVAGHQVAVAGARARPSRRGWRRRSRVARISCLPRRARTGPRRRSRSASASSSGRALRHVFAHVRGLAPLTGETGSQLTPSMLSPYAARSGRIQAPRGTSPRSGGGPNCPSGAPEAVSLPKPNTTLRRARHRRIGRNRQRDREASWRGAGTTSCSSRGARIGSTRSPTS